MEMDEVMDTNSRGGEGGEGVTEGEAAILDGLGEGVIEVEASAEGEEVEVTFEDAI